MTTLTTLAALDGWLAECEDFEGGHLVSVFAEPGRVVARLEKYLRYGLLPGDPLVVAVHELSAVPTEVTKPVVLNPGHHLECVEADERDGLLTVETWAPGTLHVVAEAFTVRRLHTLERRTTAQPDDTRFTIVARDDDDYWPRAVGALLGTPVVWRAHGSGPRAPGSDTDGCFLQLASRLDTEERGVWHERHVGGARSFSRYGADPDLWWAVRTAASGRSDLVEIRSGNCTFRPEDWRDHLVTGVLPPVERLRPRAD